VCPKCENDGKYGINLIQLLSTIKADDYSNPLRIGELQIKFRPLSYKEVNEGNLAQFQMQREISAMQAIEDPDARQTKSSEIMKLITKINMRLISSTIESISINNDVVTNSEFIQEFLEHCDRNAYENIRTQVAKIRENSTTKPQKIKCINCSHEYEQALALNITDFFD
jgi:hypothetical protein